MREASSDGRSIALPNHRYSVFLAFLEFLYTDKVPVRLWWYCW